MPTYTFCFYLADRNLTQTTTPRGEASACPRTFFRSDGRKQHMPTKRTGPSRTCARTAANTSPTPRRSPHTGEQPFPCPYCEKTFVTASVVKVHALCHLSEQPRPCTQCDKNFRTVHDLRLQLVTRPFLCEKCPNAFRTARILHNHKVSKVRLTGLVPGFAVSIHVGRKHCS